MNGISLVPEYGSTSVTLPYTKLAYNTPYSVDIPAGFVTNVSGIPNEAFSVTFTTMSRPDPIAKVFDVVVAQDGSGDYTSVKEAIDAAPSDRTSPWLIYIKAGKYQGHLEIAKPYIHLIGEDAESVIISDDRAGIMIWASLSILQLTGLPYMSPETIFMRRAFRLKTNTE